MIRPTFKEFEEAYSLGRPIPVCCETLADLETPVSVLARLQEEENVFLLESCEQGEKFGRYSFIGFNPRGIFTIENNKPFFKPVNGEKEELEYSKFPIDALKTLIGERKAIEFEGLPPLFGGAVGFMSYETVNEFETLPAPKTELTIPTVLFMITDDMLVFDNLHHTLNFITTVDPQNFSSAKAAYDEALKRLEKLQAPLLMPRPIMKSGKFEKSSRLRSNMTSDEFYDIVEKAKKAILDGECIQVVLSRKFRAEIEIPAFQLYRALRFVNPSPYTVFIKSGDNVLVGSSPETLVKLYQNQTTVRPIAGTRKRGATATEDRKNADELLRDEKERAEHLMLVDLGRNDLGRTARPGSVRVGDFMHIERYSHVMHLVSDVTAELDEKYDAFELVATTFPAGTLSGAPKIRAMEIINELEPEARGVYGGAMGYFSNTGNLDLAITIRTMTLEKNRHLTIQAGAGIVADSIPENEYQETLNKASALFKAIEIAGNGFELN